MATNHYIVACFLACTLLKLFHDMPIVGLQKFGFNMLQITDTETTSKIG